MFRTVLHRRPQVLLSQLETLQVLLNLEEFRHHLGVGDGLGVEVASRVQVFKQRVSLLRAQCRNHLFERLLGTRLGVVHNLHTLVVDRCEARRSDGRLESVTLILDLADPGALATASRY